MSNNLTNEHFCMINYNRLAYELKRDISNFTQKITIDLKRPQMKFVTQMIYGMLEVNKNHLSEIVKGYQTIEAVVLTNHGKMPLPVYEKVFQQQRKGLSVKPMKTYAVWMPSQKTLNVSVLWTEALMRMIFTDIF